MFRLFKIAGKFHDLVGRGISWKKAEKGTVGSSAWAYSNSCFPSALFVNIGCDEDEGIHDFDNIPIQFEDDQL